MKSETACSIRVSAWWLIAIVAAIRLALELGKAPNDALVFPDIEGRPQAPSDVSRTWGLTAGGMGMPEITFHSLRHYCGVLPARASLDVVE